MVQFQSLAVVNLRSSVSIGLFGRVVTAVFTHNAVKKPFREPNVMQVCTEMYWHAHFQTVSGRNTSGLPRWRGRPPRALEHPRDEKTDVLVLPMSNTNRGAGIPDE